MPPALIRDAEGTFPSYISVGEKNKFIFLERALITRKTAIIVPIRTVTIA
jgi:hypothetical protein|tara:strand:+ start:234 stop:383 length:150 start_codon:yes stop_codon:yes gene_type:complete